MRETSSPIEQLQTKTGREWPNLARARQRSNETHTRLGELLRDQDPSDTSIVVFGSLARGEYTSGSDLDWTLLIDGQADEAHYAQVQAISRILQENTYQEPGPTGVFGNFAFSHPILHQIGGQDDTNKNTTQRILLLLESLAIGKQDAHERVLRLVLSRYIDDDRGIRFSGNKKFLVPQVLLNDIVRYWRTVTVDFVSKQRERANGWALRNAKLRMSRKLIFVSGLLTCFSFVLFGQDEQLTDMQGRALPPALLRVLRARLRRTPLENLAEALLRPAVTAETGRILFDAYDKFLGVLEDKEKRTQLKRLPLDDNLGKDPLFREVMQLGRSFQEGLDRLFFKEDEILFQLIKAHGVF
ncbi:nucleotidyltransferase domain-containing protein [Chondromyces crocatus]|nr:nucleotidyltransferase domain-containing protein [Chondromyces crocatus]